MSEGLRGSLSDFGISEVFQLIGQQGKSGTLEIEGPGGRIEIRFDNGAVVSASPQADEGVQPLADMLVRCGLLTVERREQLAKEHESTLVSLRRLLVDHEIMTVPEIQEIEDLLTRETIFDLLRWREGAFHFRGSNVSHDREASDLLGAEQILMDGLRMVDEWRSFADQIPSEEIVLQAVGTLDAYRQGQDSRGAHRLDIAERVFRLVDGRSSVRRVIDLSRLGTFEATRALSELCRADVLARVDPKQLRKRRKRQRAPRPRRSFGAWVWTGLAGGALLIVGVAAHIGPSAPAPDAAIPILRNPLSATENAFATRRLRNAAEAFRFAKGRWPSSLEELADRGFVTEDALTSSEGRPYYYAEHEDGIVVLAPYQ